MNKIEKLDIEFETNMAEKDIRLGQPPEYAVIDQTNNVIQDKINEIIDWINDKKDQLL